MLSPVGTMYSSPTTTAWIEQSAEQHKHVLGEAPILLYPNRNAAMN